MLLQIVGTNPEEQQKMFGRHFELDDELVSHISRKSIDILKANYRVSDQISLMGTNWLANPGGGLVGWLILFLAPNIFTQFAMHHGFTIVAHLYL